MFLSSNHPLVLFRDFRHLFAGRLISSIGDKFFTIALAWWVISQGDADSRIHLGILMALNLLPIVLFGPFMGTLVDRFDRRKCMLVADLCRGSLAALLFLLIATGTLTLPVLYLITFFIAVFVPLFEASVSSSLQQLVDGEHLAAAVAVDSSVVYLSSILGALLGGVLMAIYGVAGAFLFNALSFCASFLFILSIRITMPAVASAVPYLEQLREGFTFLTSHRPLLYLMALFGVFNFFSAPLLLFIPMIVNDLMQASVTWVAVFEACLAAGSGLTALYFSFTRRTPTHTYPLIFAGMLLLGLMEAAIGLSADRYIYALELIGAGVAIAIVNTMALSLFQAVVPPTMKGRFFAVLTMVCVAVVPLTYLLNGFLTGIGSINAIILLNSGAAIVVSLAVLVIPKVSQPPATSQENLV